MSVKAKLSPACLYIQLDGLSQFSHYCLDKPACMQLMYANSNCAYLKCFIPWIPLGEQVWLNNIVIKAKSSRFWLSIKQKITSGYLTGELPAAICIVFFDYSKAFDTVPHRPLMQTLKCSQTDPQVVCALSLLTYIAIIMCVNGSSFNILSGVLQGSWSTSTTSIHPLAISTTSRIVLPKQLLRLTVFLAFLMHALACSHLNIQLKCHNTLSLLCPTIQVPRPWVT